MTKEEFRDEYCKAQPNAQASILAGLAHNMTVVARSYYEDGPNGRTIPSHVIIAINELEHSITGQLVHLVDGDTDRYPDDVFVSLLEDKLAVTHLEERFHWAAGLVIRRLRKMTN